MDFQSLSRRELQTLCKKNKIPANITNNAMVDALKALEIVEGIEEILKPSESESAQSSIESPERTAITSSAVPRTGGRISTRRKAIKEEPESSQICTRTRRGTRRTLASEVEEAKVDVTETAVAPGTRKRLPMASARREVETQLKEVEEDQKIGDHEKKYAPETPAAPSGRRRGTLTSACRKIETDLRKENGSSVRRVYSTRKSVRMSEKKMEESGLDMEKVSEEEASKETNDSEVISGKKSDAFSENERDFDDDQKSKGDSYQVNDSNVIHEEISEVFDKMVVISVSAEHPNKLTTEEGKGDNSESESEVSSKKCDNFDESDTLLCKALVMEDEVLENKGADDSTVDKFQPVTENYNELLKENEEKLNASEVVESEDSATEVFDNVCSDVVDIAESSVNAVNDLPSEVPARADLDVLNSSASPADQDQNKDTDLGFVSEEQFKAGEAFSDGDAATEVFPVNVCGDVVDLAAPQSSVNAVNDSASDAETDSEFHGARDLELKFATDEESNGQVSKDDTGAHSDIAECLISSNSSDQFIMKSNNASEVFSGETTVANELNAEKFATEESRVQVLVDFPDQGNMIFDTVNSPCQAKKSMLELEAMINAKEQPLPQMEAGAGVHEAAAEVPAMTTHTPASEKQNNYPHPLISEEDATDQFVSQGSMNSSNLMVYFHTEDPTPDAEKSPEVWVDVYEIEAQESDTTTNEQDSSKQGSLSCTSSEKTAHSPVPDVDPHPGQIPLFSCQAGSDSDHIPCLASSPTPGKKCSSKTPRRSPMMMATHVLDDNKENIDSGRKLDVTREKEMKNKNTSAEDKQTKSLNDASLRQLTKMLKKKLQITKEANNYEEKNTSMATRPRTALQTLPENCMRIGEAEIEN